MKATRVKTVQRVLRMQPRLSAINVTVLQDLQEINVKSQWLATPVRAALVKTVQPVLQTQPKLLATDVIVQQDSQEMNVKFKITV